MSNKVLGGFLAASIVVIAVLAWLLIATPAHAPTIEQATSTVQNATTSPNVPLHARVAVSEPKSGATVGKSFNVAGEAPGNWYFEATFPIQVRDPNDNVIGRVGASAQGDWMTTDQVAFKATIYLDGTYTGPATLVLMRDNPSGLPENDDALEIPIVIK